MKKEALLIENGMIRQRGRPIFGELYLSVLEGETLGIICDSTREKKCLLQFFKGELGLSGGSVYAGGAKRTLRETERYLKERLSVIDRTGKLIATLGVWENVCLFADRRKLLSSGRYGKEVRQLMEEFGIAPGMQDEVSRLSEKERVLIEFLKAYVEKKRIVVLADITSFLRKNELDEVKRLMVRMREQGMAFLILEPFEDIVFEWSKRIAVIRQGRTVQVLRSEHVNRQKLYEALMKSRNEADAGAGPDPEAAAKAGTGADTGPDPEAAVNTGNKAKLRPYPKAVAEAGNGPDTETDTEALAFWEVETDYLKKLTFTVEKGMALKLFLLDNESGDRIVELLCGTWRLKRGRLRLNGQDYRARSCTQAMKKGICFLPESPYERMLIYDMTVKDNISLALSRKSPLIWLRPGYARSLEQNINSYFHADIAGTKLRKLPPDILQKVAYYKWILYRPRVVVCVKPFAETDIHIQEITAQMIAAYQEQGIAVVLLTSNFSELNRIEGETVYIRNGRQIDEDQVYQILYGNE